jgi:hypothetical protein
MLTGPVMLLGVSVMACAVLRRSEHERRRACGLGAVTDPALLNRLLDLPAGEPVADPVLRAETSALAAGIADRAGDGCAVSRVLESPLVIDAVVVQARPGRELRAVQDASLFAGFVSQWVARAQQPPRRHGPGGELCGVGLLGPGGCTLMPAQPPLTLVSEDPRASAACPAEIPAAIRNDLRRAPSRRRAAIEASAPA